jgi:hypothetical protein
MPEIAVLTVTVPSAATTFSDPQGRFSFAVPAGFRNWRRSARPD